MARTKLQTPNFKLNLRADGYYDIRYTENGRLKKKATKTKNPVEAEQIRAQFSQDYRKPKLSSPIVADLCESYISYRSKAVASPENLPYSLNPVKRFLGPLKADSITQTVVNEYIENRLKERPIRKGGRWGDKPVGEATVSKELRLLRAALRWASDEGLLDRRPNFRVELSSGAVRDKWITQDEARKLEEECPTHVRLFIRIALSTAKRREAILSLTWDRVNLDRVGHEFIDFGADVGNKRRGVTTIAGNLKLIGMLKQAKNRAKTDYVIEYRGERVKDVKTALYSASRRAGLDNVSSHVLKHTAVTWMVLNGTSFERIAKFTNTSKEVIERVYGHHSPEFVADIAQAVNF